MSTNVDTEKMVAMADALYTYSDTVSKLLDELSSAANECKENLDDTYSADAVSQLSKVISQSNDSVNRAKRLAGAIQAKVEEIIRIRNL